MWSSGEGVGDREFYVNEVLDFYEKNGVDHSELPVNWDQMLFVLAIVISIGNFTNQTRDFRQK